jgi:hypothetical protein
MISITKITQATNPIIVIREGAGSKIKDAAARVSRTATLNGGAIIDHQGYSDGDRTFQITALIDQSVENTLWNLLKTQTFVNISTRDGFFYGVISFMSVNYGKLKMTLLAKE